MTKLTDEKGFTILHHAVLKGVPGKVDFVIKLAEKLQRATPEQIKDWTNSRTKKDQFTPLHFASFRGNLDAIHALISRGADKDAENFFGVNMLHVAAQGDQAASLFFSKAST